MDTPLDREAVQRLLDAAEKATPGPWEADESHVIVPVPGKSVRETPSLCQMAFNREHNAAFIVAACNLAPELARQVLAQADKPHDLCANPTCKICAVSGGIADAP